MATTNSPLRSSYSWHGARSWIERKIPKIPDGSEKHCGACCSTVEHFKAGRCNRSRPQGCERSSLLPELPGDTGSSGGGGGWRGTRGHVTKLCVAKQQQQQQLADEAILQGVQPGSPCNPSTSLLCESALWRRRPPKPVGQKPPHNGSVCPKLRPRNLELPLRSWALQGSRWLLECWTAVCLNRCFLSENLYLILHEVRNNQISANIKPISDINIRYQERP